VDKSLAGSEDAYANMKAAQDESAVAGDDAADSATRQAAALAELSGQASSAEIDINELADAIRGSGSMQLNVNSATRDFEAAIDELTESVLANGTSLDVNSEQGRANEAALDNIAQSALNAAAAIVEQTGSQEDASNAVARGREELILALEQFGITGTAADEYADKLRLISGDVTTAIGLSGIDDASGRPSALRAEIEAISKSVGISISMDGNVTYSDARNGRTDAARSGDPALPRRTRPASTPCRSVRRSSATTAQATQHRTLLKAINDGASVKNLQGMSAGAGAFAFADGGTASSLYNPATYADTYGLPILLARR
jgi:hypothetical protein